jgi:hypothetical protein
MIVGGNLKQWRQSASHGDTRTISPVRRTSERQRFGKEEIKEKKKRRKNEGNNGRSQFADRVDSR